LKHKLTIFKNVATQITYQVLKNLKEVVRNPPSRKSLLTFITLFLFPLNNTLSFAETNLKIPAEYGEVIYQSSQKSPNQLFIIGICHRDFFTLRNGSNTSRVQAEVYRIGDWFIHNQGVELLLPEGFFKNGAAKIQEANPKAGFKKGSSCVDFSDTKALEERLSDDKTYVNAEMLLKESHQLRTEQVEDKELYDAVTKCIVKLVNSETSSSDCLLLKSEADYLQERRTAAMLQKIPEIIEKESRQGNIKSEKAILTIGLSHLPKIIEYLNRKRITIYSPLSISRKSEDYIADLNLIKENFAVYIIIPRTLANDKKVLKINGLDKIMAQFRKQQSSVDSP
jgi:hypothetical protein